MGTGVFAARSVRQTTETSYLVFHTVRMSTNLCCRCRLSCSYRDRYRNRPTQFNSKLFYLTLFFVTFFYTPLRIGATVNGDTSTTFGYSSSVSDDGVTTTITSGSAFAEDDGLSTTVTFITTTAASPPEVESSTTVVAADDSTPISLVLNCTQPNYPHNTKEICLIEHQNLPAAATGAESPSLTRPVRIISNDPTNVTTINITNVPLGHIPIGLGETFPKLEILQLNNCNTSSISGLGNVPKLKKLYLDKNQLTEVEEGQLAGAPNLRLFEATENQIETISSKAFAGNLLLYWLDLGRNRIGGLPWGCFEGLTSLVSLVLSHNMIDDIRGVFQGLEGLSTLDLSFNEIREIHDLTFERTTNLEKIYLQNNKIENLARTAFDHCSRLRSIDLSYNMLKSFHFDLPSEQFATFNIAFNDLSEFALTSRLEHLSDLQIYAQNNSISTVFVQEGIPVTELYLHHNQLKSLISLTKLYSLTVLNLRGNDLSETTTDLEAFKNLQRLAELDLSHTRINKNYLPVLFQLENLNRVLELSDNPSVAEFEWGQLSPSPLQAIRLNGCNLTSLNVEGLKTTLQRLSEIEINDNRFTCSELHKILISLAVNGVDVKKTDRAGDNYIEGILCLNESTQITKLEPVSPMTLKKNSEDFPQSDQSPQLLSDTTSDVGGSTDVATQTTDSTATTGGEATTETVTSEVVAATITTTATTTLTSTEAVASDSDK